MASEAIIPRVAKSDLADQQVLHFSKDPGPLADNPITVVADIGTDAPPPRDRKYVPFDLAAMKQANGGPWADAQFDTFVLRLRDVRDRAVALGFPNP